MGRIVFLFFVVLMARPTAAQWTPGHHVHVEPADHMTETQRARIWSDIREKQARLLLPKAGARPSFRWPLRAARGYSDPAFYRISNYVDQDPAFPNKVRDFSCGDRTYDTAGGYNHAGTDISIVPDSWNLMAAQQIEIIAAADGTIVFKSDGNFDQHCRFNNDNWNAVYVQHDDGSIAWYGHMKRGSQTTKAIGQRVVTGEFLGNVGSSGSSTGPHLHFEVYDAANRLIDPWAGTCNTLNAESWWAQQPPTVQTRITGVSTASASPSFGTCGSDGRMATPGSVNAKTSFAPGDALWIIANVRDQPKDSAVLFTVRTPDGAVYSQSTAAAASDFFIASTWWFGSTIPAGVPFGTWSFEATLGGTIVSMPFTVTADGSPISNFTDLWWNPQEPGWGVNLNHQGDVLFATWFTYDADGEGMWLVMSEARLQGGGSYAGTIYRTTGVPFAQINGHPAANSPIAAVGTGSFRFSSVQRGTFAYTLNGIPQQKSIERQGFSTPTTCMATAGTREGLTNYQDLWFNPTEPGWGVNLTQQGDTIFATWFTYGAGGRGQWLVASNAQRQPTGEFTGRLYRTHGIPFDRISGASAVTATPADVGSVTLSFTSGESGRLAYVLDGVAQAKSISRQTFARTTPLCK